jgi:multicomponent Na+:H+ antiporter subunit B
MRRKTLLRVISKALIPFILLFALYTQFHGDFGPGGGFQAGVIFAAAFVLYSLIFGLEQTKAVVDDRTMELLAASGVLLYGAVGTASLVLGGNFLDYDVLHPEGGHYGQHLGILWVELGVGITVAAVMIVIFASFAGRGRNVG